MKMPPKPSVCSHSYMKDLEKRAQILQESLVELNELFEGQDVGHMIDFGDYIRHNEEKENASGAEPAKQNVNQIISALQGLGKQGAVSPSAVVDVGSKQLKTPQTDDTLTFVNDFKFPDTDNSDKWENSLQELDSQQFLMDTSTYEEWTVSFEVAPNIETSCHSQQ